MKGRIYLSEDRGGCALIAAALDVMSDRSLPTAQEVALWGMETGMNWSQPGLALACRRSSGKIGILLRRRKPCADSGAVPSLSDADA